MEEGNVRVKNSKKDLGPLRPLTRVGAPLGKDQTDPLTHLFLGLGSSKVRIRTRTPVPKRDL